jgi:hypothetical protein
MKTKTLFAYLLLMLSPYAACAATETAEAATPQAAAGGWLPWAASWVDLVAPGTTQEITTATTAVTDQATALDGEARAAAAEAAKETLQTLREAAPEIRAAFKEAAPAVVGAVKETATVVRDGLRLHGSAAVQTLASSVTSWLPKRRTLWEQRMDNINTYGPCACVAITAILIPVMGTYFWWKKNAEPHK